MTTFDDAIEDLFDTFDDCEDATYKPLSGSPVSCRVNISKEIDPQPIGAEGRAWASGIVLEYRIDEVGQRASRDDVFTVGTTDYKVKSVIEGDERIIKVSVTT